MYGANLKEREVQMSRNLQEMFYGKSYWFVLYVSANKKQYFLGWSERTGYSRIVAPGELAENAKFLNVETSDRTPALEVVHGDVQDEDAVLGDAFDVAVFWHRIEHLLEDEIVPVLEKLEAVSKVVVLGYLHGVYEQGPECGNPYEEYLPAAYPRFLEGLGYRTDVVGKTDKRGSDIMGWKFTRHGHAEGVRRP